jgi:hypothetical protein
LRRNDGSEVAMPVLSRDTCGTAKAGCPHRKLVPACNEPRRVPQFFGNPEKHAETM